MSPLNVVLVTRGGEISDSRMMSGDSTSFHRKCGFKTPTAFGCRVTWPVPSKLSSAIPFKTVTVWGKTDGKAGCENKYDFPPPIDSILLFGTVMVVGRHGDEYCSITTGQWGAMYDHLFGGFENLADTAAADENEIDELADIPSEMKTRDGYLRDGFVVDSDDEGDDIYNSDGELTMESYR
jgi:hypothetical protein